MASLGLWKAQRSRDLARNHVDGAPEFTSDPTKVWNIKRVHTLRGNTL